MTDHKWRFPGLLIAVFGLLAPAATVQGQTIVVTAKSVNDLADDLEYVIKTVAPPGDPMVQVALDNLEKVKSGELIKGLDRRRGFGLTVTLPRDFPQGGPPSIVAAVPVSDLGQLLDSLKALGLEVDDKPGVEGFSHKVSVPNANMSLFVLQSKGYALFSLLSDGADKLREVDPSSWSKKARPGTAMSVRVQVSEIPEGLKEHFLNQLDAQLEQQRERKPGENDSTYQGRLAGQDLGHKAIKAVVTEGDAFTLDLGLDRKSSELSVELAMTARPGTAMAKDLRAFGEKRSRFEVLDRDAALAAWARVPVAKEFREMMVKVSDRGIEQGVSSATSPEQKELLKRLGELVKSNLDAPEVDLGMAIRPSSPAGAGDRHYVILGGMSLRDAREAERLIRDSAAQIPRGKGVELSFDVAKAGDGTPIHRMTGPFDEKNAKVARQFGKPSISCAFRGDVFYYAFGEDSTDALRRHLDAASTPTASRSEGPVAVDARVAALAEFGDKNQEAIRLRHGRSLQR